MPSQSPKHGSITQAIARVRQLDDDAAALLWNRYFERLSRYAQTKVDGRHQRYYDGEEIAAAAMYALVDGLRKQRFLTLESRDGLWQLLVTITANKASNNRKLHDRQKRGGGKVHGLSGFEGSDKQSNENSDKFIRREDDPAAMVELEQTCQEMLRQLPDDSYRKIALMRMAGHTNEEMAEEFNCTTRTIERKLVAIRKVWIRVSGVE